MDINVTKTIDDVEHKKSVTYDFGADLDSMIELFGAEVVANNARQSMVISLQALVRGKITEKADKLQALADAWKPGVKKPKKSKVDKAKSIMADLSQDEIDAILAKYK